STLLPLFILMTSTPPISTLFPYTTLFRSGRFLLGGEVMKKKYIICIASVLFVLIVCIWISYRHSKQYVFTYVQNHTDELTEYAEEIIETAPNHTLSYEG